jgi:nicotinamide phosphoribosyltransferase
MLFKDPATDDGGKRSARGRLAVLGGFGGMAYTMKDALTVADQARLKPYDALRAVWKDGGFQKRVSLTQIRSVVRA